MAVSRIEITIEIAFVPSLTGVDTLGNENERLHYGCEDDEDKAASLIHPAPSFLLPPSGETSLSGQFCGIWSPEITSTLCYYHDHHCH
ncbi:unnamed protein product [Taenia asiatica]|uniref:Uncharacterized protein n=1 Tax=Taenia asiatica TaxID=60517 RepID=A0A0R3WG73_TAEAS|nr:unnamed protein product [Taenia asiatica]